MTAGARSSCRCGTPCSGSVRPGASLVMGTCLEQMIPFAPTREIIARGSGPHPDRPRLRHLLRSAHRRRALRARGGGVGRERHDGPGLQITAGGGGGEDRGRGVLETSRWPWRSHAAAIGSPYVRRGRRSAPHRGGKPLADPDPGNGRSTAPRVKGAPSRRGDRAPCRCADPQGNAILWGSLGITSDAVRASRAGDRDGGGDRQPGADPA